MSVSLAYGERTYHGHCHTAGKVIYPTRRYARRIARRIYPAEALRAYPCGDHWHIGNTPDWRKRGLYPPWTPAGRRAAAELATAPHTEGAGHPTASPSKPATRKRTGASLTKEKKMTTTLAPATTAELDAIIGAGPTAVVVTISPALALDLLKRNTHNRKLRERVVATYARDITAGNWTLNGEAIKVARNGDVLDGQHRLHAIIQADQTVDIFVVIGLDPAAQETMDSGRKRTTADVLNLRKEENAYTLAAVLRRVWAWQQGDHRFKGRVTPTTAECAALLTAEPSIRRSAEIAQRVRNAFPHIPQSVLGTCHFLFNQLDEGDAAWFFQRLADGAELPIGHPILALRTRVTSERLDNVRLAEDRFMAYLIRTWNAVRDGRELARLVHKPGSEIPLPK